MSERSRGAVRREFLDGDRRGRARSHERDRVSFEMLLLSAPSGALLAPTGFCSRTDAVTAHATTRIARTATAVASASAAAELAPDFADLPEGMD